MPTRTRLKLEGPCCAFITTTVKDWCPAFSEQRMAEAVVSQFREALVCHGVSCHAYVLMPSHLHAVIGVRDYPLIAKFMQSFKILSSKRMKELMGAELLRRFTHNGRYQFWQPRYDELVIVSERQFRTKIDYIHNNPVRAGLVAIPSEWKLSSARDWTGSGRGIIPIDRDFSFQE